MSDDLSTAMNDDLNIDIQDESTHNEERFQLYINGAAKALVTKKNGMVQMHWQVHGPQHWPNAKVLMQGLLELSIIADQLSGEKNGR